MDWSKNPPNDSGWFWHRKGRITKPVQLRSTSAGYSVAVFGSKSMPAGRLLGLWWPERIEEPE